MEDYNEPEYKREPIRRSGRLDDYKVNSEPEDLHKTNLPEPEKVPKQKKIGERVQLNYFQRTKLGRTLSGRNKLGQALQVAGQTALAFTPLKALKDATGRITDITEAASIGKRTKDLNLSDNAVLYIRLIVVLTLVAAIAFGSLGLTEAGTLLRLLETFGVLGLMAGFGVASAVQGDKFRVVSPVRRRIPGQPEPATHYSFFLDGQEFRDEAEEVVIASEHVDYPRGPSDGYRHVDYINQHPERFELIEAASDTPN